MENMEISLEEDEHFQMIERRLQMCEKIFWECADKVGHLKLKSEKANILLKKIMDKRLDKNIAIAKEANDED